MALATIIHVRIGEVAFGTTPGSAVVMATVRADDEQVMGMMRRALEETAQRCAAEHRLGCEVSWTEEFPVTVNDPRAVELVRESAEASGLQWHHLERPLGWSEDFGWFLRSAAGALFGIGAGRDQPALHSEEYDFPDRLLPVGARLFSELVKRSLSTPEETGADLR